MGNNSKNSNAAVILISSSSDEDGDDDNQQDEFQSESEFECASDDDDYDESESDGQELDDDDDGMFSDYQKFDNGDGDCHDDERICSRVVRLLKERRNVQVLNLSECKSYLRRHGLRLSGTKAECIERINEHWRLGLVVVVVVVVFRIKDGSGEALYPRSSFSINCTGDVCKGDTVLFTQKVYEKFDKMTRRGGPLGKRTIAGRIVKESYGAAKQQHTFTVEVLWSKGLKILPPLFPLLVKGRNLYKLRTFRQRWKSEGERLKVLDEKHRRGAAARHTRAIRKTKHASCINAGAKHQKKFHLTPSQKKQTAKGDRGKCASRRGTSQVKTRKSNNHPQYFYPVNLTGPSRSRTPACQSDSYFSHNYYLREYQNQTPRFSHLRCDLNSHRNLSSEGFNRRPHLHHAYSHSNHNPVTRNSNQYPRSMNTSQPMHPYYPADEYEHRKYGD